MEPIALIVASLAAGAAAGLKPTAEHAVKDAYNGLKSLISRKYARFNVERLEQSPHSKARQAVAREDLTAEGADQDAEILTRARALLEVIQAYAPEAAEAVGVDLSEIKGASLNIDGISARDTGVRVRGGEFAGDISITNVRSGNSEEYPPK